jgi:hypothetical protein
MEVQHGTSFVCCVEMRNLPFVEMFPPSSGAAGRMKAAHLKTGPGPGAFGFPHDWTLTMRYADHLVQP